MARKQTEAMSYGIIGLGRFGSALAATLAEADEGLYPGIAGTCFLYRRHCDCGYHCR